MKKQIKLINLFAMALLLTTFGCNNDDEVIVNNEISVQNLNVTIDENPTNGQSVGTVQADGGSTLSFNIASQTPTGALTISANSGELSVADATLFDFETNPVITANISVNSSGNTETAIATISLNDLDEIGAQDLTVSIDENPTNGDSVGTVQVAGNGPFSFSIDSQTPNGALTIGASSGELTIADAALFDFELNPVITANISMNNSTSTETATATINLNNVNELSVQDFSATIDENPANGDSIGTVQADGDATLSFDITSQTPTGALQINPTTGELTVADATLFDFETNPVITANIAVDNSGNTETLVATISLNDLNEISVQDLNTDIDENPTNGQSVGTVQVDGNGPFSFSIESQTPAGALSIDAASGELTVANATLFDFETNPVITTTISVVGANNMGTVTIDLNNVDEIGDFNYGGVIFWLDGNGGGLVSDIDNLVNTAAPNSGITWSIGTNTNTGATGNAIGTGQANTTAIINNHGAGVYAAALCDNLTTSGYSDWYLPSLFELAEMYSNLATINTTAEANGGSAIVYFYFWSSTEVNTDQARIMVNNGGVASQGKNNSGAFVRAIRTFTNF